MIPTPSQFLAAFAIFLVGYALVILACLLASA